MFVSFRGCMIWYPMTNEIWDGFAPRTLSVSPWNPLWPMASCVEIAAWSDWAAKQQSMGHSGEIFFLNGWTMLPAYLRYCNFKLFFEKKNPGTWTNKKNSTRSCPSSCCVAVGWGGTSSISYPFLAAPTTCWELLARIPWKKWSWFLMQVGHMLGQVQQHP